jgi:hypothetical protein
MMMDLAARRNTRPELFPVGSGLALIGAVLMIVGASGPWIGGKLFQATSGVDLGGDGWLVVAAASLALVPLLLPLRRSSAKGLWVLTLAVGAAYVCWIHYQQAGADGFQVVWGLELSAIGAGLLGLAGFRLLKR